jgi:hypothetical protein
LIGAKKTEKARVGEQTPHNKPSRSIIIIIMGKANKRVDEG